MQHGSWVEVSMTDAALSYERLEVRILRGRALGILPEETEDAILEENGCTLASHDARGDGGGRRGRRGAVKWPCSNDRRGVPS